MILISEMVIFSGKFSILKNSVLYLKLELESEYIFSILGGILFHEAN